MARSNYDDDCHQVEVVVTTSSGSTERHFVRARTDEEAIQIVRATAHNISTIWTPGKGVAIFIGNLLFKRWRK